MGVHLDDAASAWIQSVTADVFNAFRRMGLHVLGVDVPFSNYVDNGAHKEKSHDILGSFQPGPSSNSFNPRVTNAV